MSRRTRPPPPSPWGAPRGTVIQFPGTGRRREIVAQSFSVGSAFLFGALAVALYLRPDLVPSLTSFGGIGAPARPAVQFALCGDAHDDNCVVDGDTFHFGGEKIRIADIDAPETHPSRCEHEAELGAAATSRLAELLSEGPFVLRTQGRDEDQYGRKLRIVAREGRSLGAILVREGLAREWTGRREPWCA